MDGQLVFVTASAGGSMTSGDKARVRSQCMKGRNKKDGSRRSKREARRAVKEARRSAVAALTPSSSSSPYSNASSPSVEDESPEISRAVSVLSRIPPPPPPDVALIRFADELKPVAQESIDQLIRFSDIKNIMYPIHDCVDFDQYMTDHSPWLLSDPVFFHTALMSVFSMKCIIQGQPPSKLMYFHQRKALTLLNERLSRPDALEYESTVWVIQLLALIGGLLHDFSATRAHLAGLKQIIKLKGGPGFLEKRPKLHFKIENLDLLTCLRSGNTPTFLVEPGNWEPLFGIDANGDDKLLRLDDTLYDSRIVSTYNDLQHLSGLVHGLLQKKQRLDAVTFQSILHSVQSRLIHLKDILQDAPSMCICLGMLAYLTTVFSFPGKKIMYAHLGVRLRWAFQRLMPHQLGADDLLLWLSVISSMMAVDAAEECVGDLLRAIRTPITAWRQARTKLLSVMWIGPLQDEAGKKSFSELMKHHKPRQRGRR